MSPTLQPHSIAVVLGTRPELIKLAPLIHLLGDAVRLVHTGQHFDHDLSPAFLDELGLPPPAVQLEVGARARGAQIGDAVSELDRHFHRHRPAAVVVQGDTNATLAGALAANAGEIPLVHVEAGLRSHDRRMPEEHNRVLVDHLADRCLAPTDHTVANLAAEGITGDRVVLTGNTVVEAVSRLCPDEPARRALLGTRSLEPDRFVLATIHRPENTDDPANLGVILDELGGLELPVLLPLHPRTTRRVEEFGLRDRLDRLRPVDPLSHAEFLALMSHAALVVSDSGGVQEEVTVVKRPAIIVRRSTERPEAVGTFTELVEPGPSIGDLARGLLTDIAGIRTRLESEPSPYGDGEASRRTLDEIERLVRDA